MRKAKIGFQLYISVPTVFRFRWMALQCNSQSVSAFFYMQAMVSETIGRSTEKKLMHIIGMSLTAAASIPVLQEAISQLCEHHLQQAKRTWRWLIEAFQRLIVRRFQYLKCDMIFQQILSKSKVCPSSPYVGFCDFLTYTYNCKIEIKYQNPFFGVWTISKKYRRITLLSKDRNFLTAITDQYHVLLLLADVFGSIVSLIGYLGTHVFITFAFNRFDHKKRLDYYSSASTVTR